MTQEQKRLQWSGFALMIIGVTFAATAIPAVYSVIKLFFTLAHWPFNGAVPVLDHSARLLLAISGGLTTGLGAMSVAVARAVMPVSAAAGRTVVLYAAMAWFAVDSTFSVVAGSPFNVVLNLPVLALLLAPLALRRGQRQPDDASEKPA